MAHPFLATMIGGGLEGCGPSQPLPAVNRHPFHGADGAGALVRLKVRTNSGVEVPIGQSTGCP